MQNLMFDVQRLKVLGPDEGTTATAEMLLPVVEWMTSAFAEPDGDTLRLRYEDFERSSDSFDREVDKLLDFFFAASSSPAWAAPLISEGEPWPKEVRRAYLKMALMPGRRGARGGKAE
eukprot:g9186.t1